MNLHFDASYAHDLGRGVTASGAGATKASATVGSPPYVTAEQFKIRQVSVDRRSVQPGDTVTFTTEYGSDFGSFVTRFDIDTDHPDYCTVPKFGFSPGADLYVEVTSATSAATPGGCMDVSNNDSAVESVDVAVPLTGGTETIEAQLKGGKTGRVYDREEIEVQVDDRAGGGAVRPPPDDDDNGDDNESNGTNPLQDFIDSLTLGTGNATAPLAVLVVILVILLYVGVAV